MSKATHYSISKLESMSSDAREKLWLRLLCHAMDNISDSDILEQFKSQLRIFCQTYVIDATKKDTAIKIIAENNPHALLALLHAALDEHSITRTDTQIKIRTMDMERRADPKALARAQNVVLILDNLRSVFNVGSIFRTAECLAIKELCLCGITPTPLQQKLHKTAMGTAQRVAWTHYEDTVVAIQKFRDAGFTIYALETAETATNIYDFEPRFPLALLIGNESLGINPALLPYCDLVIELPVLGWKNSLNVGTALAVSAYQLIMNKL